MTALSVHDLAYRYGRRDAVQGVSLHVEPGDCYGFLGHNGAGKTTVLRLCLGLLAPHRGRVRIFGSDVATDGRMARAHTGALVERPGFHPRATAWQNLVWLGRLQGLTRPLAQAEASRALDRTGLSAAADRAVGTFSLGMRQRLGVAQALLGSPRLLLLDEPANGLDPEGIADLRALLRQLTREEGVAVLLSSHQLQELEGLCNRIGVLREGRMVVEGAVGALRARLQTHHLVAGAPREALAARLQALGLAAERTDEALRVDLAGRPPAAVLRQLTAVADVVSFAPEPVTLEAIYRRAEDLAGVVAEGPSDPAAPSTPTTPAEAPEVEGQPPPSPRWRAFAHELRVLRGRRSTFALLALPSAVAFASVLSYAHRVAQGLERVRVGERFSADAGSAQLAALQALQAAVPTLGVVLLWFASQSLAADVARDTLRNTLQRAVTRTDVLLGKAGALGAVALTGLVAAVAAAVLTGALRIGFHDLEEITKGGDHQVLAASAQATAALWTALRHLLLPLGALAALALAASAVAARPALALGLALLFVVGPELLRPTLGEHAGWLLSSHLPTALRDDSVLGWATATARGAADANWPWQSRAVLAPLAWLGAALLLAWQRLRRLRLA